MDYKVGEYVSILSFRFELMSRSEFKETPEFSLELKRVQGEQLNQHLISFVEKYRRRCDEVTPLRQQLEAVQAENKKLRDQSKRKETDMSGRVTELEEQNAELLEAIRNPLTSAILT